MMTALWRRDWARLDGYTPDVHMILARAPDVEGLHMAEDEYAVLPFKPQEA